MITSIGKAYSFDAAHQLPNHDGQCRRRHGHTYRVQIEVRGEVKQTPAAPDQGMVLDYGALDEIWKQALEPRLDHRDLNDSIGYACWPTTAENIAAFILGVVRDKLFPRFPRLDLIAVEVSETPKTFARVEARL